MRAKLCLPDVKRPPIAAAMRQRLALRQILLQRLFRLQTSRPFTSNISSTVSRGGSSRPQLPFLSIPVTTTTRPKVRYFTTERKQWLKYEGRLFVRYMVCFWGGVACITLIKFLLKHEVWEREHPTPHEWRWSTRGDTRQLMHLAKDRQTKRINWVEIITAGKMILSGLENPEDYGDGIVDLVDEPLVFEGVSAVGKDLSAKSENWRRGYFGLRMLMALALEQMDGHVVDRTRGIVFPPELVVGPSNPRPKPIPAGSRSAPREEDCEIAFESAEDHYLAILATKGFTSRQKMDASLAYAAFLDYKKRPEAAEKMYERALSLATEMDPSSSSSSPVVDAKTYTLTEKKSHPSENVLTVLTSIATHKARTGDVSAALPIFLSVLRARRALPQTPLPGQERPENVPATFTQRLWNLTKAPEYPPPPDDGSRPPWRHSKELCEEAGLSLYIGEILFSSSSKNVEASREQGIAWTRDAVDIAEEQLRKVGTVAGDREARQTCRECLSTGLGNWSVMAARMVREAEQAKNKAGSTASAFGFWSEPRPADDGRWAAEEKVIRDRIQRTGELLLHVEPSDNLFVPLLNA